MRKDGVLMRFKHLRQTGRRLLGMRKPSKPVSVYVACPVLEKADVRFFTALYDTMLSSGFNCMPAIRMGDGCIMRVRSEQISDFLNGPCDYYMQISSDMEILNRTAEDNAIRRLVARDKPFLGVIYSQSMDPVRCTSLPMEDKPREDGLWKMKWLSGGFWFLRRDGVEQMVKAHPELDYDSKDGVVHGVFMEFIHAERGVRALLTEDYAYCQRWLDLGGEIWADTDVRVRHWGWKGYELPYEEKK